MLIPKHHDCLLAILIIHQASALMVGCKTRPTESLSFRDSTSNFSSVYNDYIFPASPVRLMMRSTRSRLGSMAVVDPYTEESSSSSSSSFESSKLKPPVNTATGTQSSRNNKRKHTNGKKKPRRDNPAMGDTVFLRKRTADLLASSDSSASSNDLSGGNMKVKNKTFNFLIDAWAFSGELEAADQALKLLDRMEELQEHKDDSINVRPDVRSYTKVINAVSRSMRPDAGEIAESILEKMDNLYTSGTNKMAKPNTFTYTAVIEAYTNSGAEGSAEKAEELLDTMTEKYEDGDSGVQPTARCFNAVITAYGKSGYPGAAQQAQYLFDRMGDLYMSGVSECKPNTFNYNSLIIALANSAEEGTADRAAELLERMERCHKSGDPDIKPTTVTFNAVINAFAKSGNAQRAEEILLHMEKLYEAGEDVKPNTRSFNSVINAWAKSNQEDAAQHAQDLFDFMNGLYETANKSLRPDVHSFSTVINAWGRSRDQGKAVHANELFKTMVKAYKAGNKKLKPNIVVVNAVINACAYTYGDLEEQQQAMEIAHNQLKELESGDYGSPDHLTYGTFLKVCANQMEDCDTRRQITEVIIKKCIRDGQFGNIVLQQLKAMVPPDTYFNLVGHDIDKDIKMEDLPSEWCSNVVEGKWRRRRNLK